MSMTELDDLLRDLGQGIDPPESQAVFEEAPYVHHTNYNNDATSDLDALVADLQISAPPPSGGAPANFSQDTITASSPTELLKQRIQDRRISRRVSSARNLPHQQEADRASLQLDPDIISSNELSVIDNIIASLDTAPSPSSSPASVSAQSPNYSRPDGNAPPPSRPISTAYSQKQVHSAISQTEPDLMLGAPSTQPLSNGAGVGSGSFYGAGGNNYDYSQDPNMTSNANCGACSKPIFGQLIQAGTAFYHPQCFMCHGCGAGLGAGRFYKVDGKPRCETCYAQQKLERCVHCEKPITGACIDALEKKWHVNCFICSQCLKPFGTSPFYERDGNPFCEGCFYGIFSDRCGGCDQPIRGESINACGKQWHPEHFVCMKCKQAFGPGGMYWEHNGMPYCQLHYVGQQGMICGCGCGKHCMGARVVSALGKMWIEGHFVCGFCVNPLSDLRYKEKDGKGYCETCYTKLFTGFKY